MNVLASAKEVVFRLLFVC